MVKAATMRMGATAVMPWTSMQTVLRDIFSLFRVRRREGVASDSKS